MNKEDVIEMVRKAGATVINVPGVGEIVRYNDVRITNFASRFAVLIAEFEREECAKICESKNPHPDEYSDSMEYTEKRVALDCARSIRSKA